MFRIRNVISFGFKNWHALILSSCWLFGLYAGYAFVSYASATSISLMRSIAENRMSIIGLLLILNLPFVVSAVFLRYSQTVLLFATVFLKAFCFSWCAYSLTVAFGDAGWLVRWLLLFSDSCSVVLLLWFLFRNTVNTSVSLCTDLLFCVTASITIGCIDFCVVSPFVERLLNH